MNDKKNNKIKMNNLKTFENYNNEENNDLNNQLIKCIENNDQEGAITLIDNGANVNQAYKLAMKQGKHYLAKQFEEEYGADNEFGDIPNDNYYN